MICKFVVIADINKIIFITHLLPTSLTGIIIICQEDCFYQSNIESVFILFCYIEYLGFLQIILKCYQLKTLGEVLIFEFFYMSILEYSIVSMQLWVYNIYWLISYYWSQHPILLGKSIWGIYYSEQYTLVNTHEHCISLILSYSIRSIK